MKRKSRYHDTLGFATDPRGNSAFKGVRPREIPATPGMVPNMLLRAASGSIAWPIIIMIMIGNGSALADANWGFMHAPDMALDLGKTHDQETDRLGREDRVGKIILIPKAGG